MARCLPLCFAGLSAGLRLWGRVSLAIFVGLGHRCLLYTCHSHFGKSGVQITKLWLANLLS